MNTFLPYSDFEQSAKCLDRQRLGKQRVEVLQILRAMVDETKGWKNHPCTKMWENYRNALVKYGEEICKEWKRRGYKDTCHEKILAYYEPGAPLIYPDWIYDEKFLISHQSNLVRKDEDHYRKYFPDILSDLEYIWPIGEK